MNNIEVFDIPNIKPTILKAASEAAKRIIDENSLWFSQFYHVANEGKGDAENTVSTFWRSLKSKVIMEDRPNWFVPYKVLLELVDISRKNYSLQKKKR